jgi:hypothetical protein
LNLPVFLWR